MRARRAGFRQDAGGWCPQAVPREARLPPPESVVSREAHPQVRPLNRSWSPQRDLGWWLGGGFPLRKMNISENTVSTPKTTISDGGFGFLIERTILSHCEDFAASQPRRKGISRFVRSYVCIHTHACAHTATHPHPLLYVLQDSKEPCESHPLPHTTEGKLMPDKEVRSVPRASSPRVDVRNPVMVTSASFSLHTPPL